MEQAELATGIAHTLIEQSNKVFDNAKPSKDYCEMEGDKLVACCGIYALNEVHNYYEKGMVVNPVVMGVASDIAYNAMVKACDDITKINSDGASVVAFFSKLPTREEIAAMFNRAKELI